MSWSGPPSHPPDELLRGLVRDGVTQALGTLVVAPAQELGAQPEVRRFSPQQQVQPDLWQEKNACNAIAIADQPSLMSNRAGYALRVYRADKHRER